MLFNDSIIIELHRGSAVTRGTVMARVVDNGIAEPFAESSSAGSIKDVMVFVKDDAIIELGQKPTIGDIVVNPAGERFAISAVNELGVGITTLKARSC